MPSMPGCKTSHDEMSLPLVVLLGTRRSACQSRSFGFFLSWLAYRDPARKMPTSDWGEDGHEDMETAPLTAKKTGEAPPHVKKEIHTVLQPYPLVKVRQPSCPVVVGVPADKALVPPSCCGVRRVLESRLSRQARSPADARRSRRDPGPGGGLPDAYHSPSTIRSVRAEDCPSVPITRCQTRCTRPDQPRGALSRGAKPTGRTCESADRRTKRRSSGPGKACPSAARS